MVTHLSEATRRAVHENNWHAALALALTLPDICGRLQHPEVRSSQKRYEAWWQDWMHDAYATQGGVLLSGADAYALRCAVLHEGRDEVVEHKAREAISNFVFIEPVNGQGTHAGRIDSVMVLRVDAFCEDICAGVDGWVAHINAADEAAAARASNLMRVMRYPVTINGVYISG